MKKLVQKFLNNKCTPEEANRVFQWLQTKEGEEYFIDQVAKDGYQFFNTSATENYPELDSGKLFDEINNKRKSEKHSSLHTGGYADIHLPDKNLKRFKYWKLISIAAAVIFLFVKVMINQQAEDPSSISEEINSWHIVEADRGEQKTIRLPDRSKVILNHESRISVPDNFSETNRMVAISGEVWFEVVTDIQNPFIIHSSNSVIRVLGTSFMITSHPGENKTRVIVEHGKVSLGSNEDAAVEEKIIEMNQGGELITGGQVTLQEIPDLDLFTGWKDGKLIFHKTPFEEVTERIERWYDVTCIIEEPALREELFTSEFENESLDQVLDVIALSMNIHYERENRTITFKNK